MKKFSIILVTYNPDWNKVRLTLESVVRQKFSDYEIIVSDDGSADNCFDKIEGFLKEHGITDYTMLPHEKNQGTVKNLLDAVRHASGKYVRDFGPGDLFYGEDTLQKVYDFFEETGAEGCFGLMRGYCAKEDGTISYVDFPHPFDLDAYIREDVARIQKNLVLYRDNASGACTCYRREYYLEYLKKLETVVVYTEDIFQLLAGLENRPLSYFPDYLVWYEADSGVSTKKKSSFAEKLALDVEHFYEYLHEHFPDNINVRKQKRVFKLYKIRNLYARTFLRFFVNPDAIRYLISHWMQVKKGRYVPKTASEGFLENGFEKFLGEEAVNGDY